MFVCNTRMWLVKDTITGIGVICVPFTTSSRLPCGTVCSACQIAVFLPTDELQQVVTGRGLTLPQRDS